VYRVFRVVYCRVRMCCRQLMHRYAQNPLHTFSRNFPVDEEAANLLRTCYGETGVMGFGLCRLIVLNALLNSSLLPSSENSCHSTA